MKNFLLTLILFLLATGCAIQTESESQTSEVVDTSYSDQETVKSSLQTYQSSAYGFKFQFSAAWVLNATNVRSNSFFENRIVSLGLDENAYKGTNVSGASFVVNVQSEESLEACLNEKIDVAASKHFSMDDFETVNGVIYYFTSGGEGLTGPNYNAKFKRTYREGQCFEIVESMFSSDIGFYGADTNTIDAVDDIWNRLDSIFQSFTFES